MAKRDEPDGVAPDGFGEAAGRSFRPAERARPFWDVPPPHLDEVPFPDAAPARAKRPHYHGHRQRVRDRFAAGGAESMPDYEIIEMLLFNAIPYKDVKPLAKQLLDDFGGLERLLTASRGELLAHPEVDTWIAHQMKLAEALAIRLAKVRVTEQPVMGGTDAVVTYLRVRLGHSPIEHFRILFLDVKNRLIADEEHGRGTINHTPVYPREVVTRALELKAAGVVLVHNHPSGDTTPSHADVALTTKIAAALDIVGVRLCDHLIIGGGEVTSLRGEGFL